MAGISVRSAFMTFGLPRVLDVAAGAQLQFDFSADVGEDETVLAYTFGLSSFQAQYATNSQEASEPVGQMGVTLIPNLVGSTLYVTANIILTNFGGSGAAEPQDVSGRCSYVGVAAIAYIGTSLPAEQAAVLCTAYELSGTGTNSPTILTSSSPQAPNQFLSGFDVYVSPLGNTNEPSEFSVSTACMGTGLVTLSGKIALANKDSSAGTVDMGLISTNGIDNYGVQPFSFSCGSQSGPTGWGASQQATFSIPEGYSSIANAAVLIQSVDLTMSAAHYLQVLQFGINNAGEPSINGDQVSYSLGLNMFGNRDGDYHLQSGKITGFVIAQFA